MDLKNSLLFLDDLKANNNREWFLENKKRYDDYKKSYHELIGQFLNEMKPHDATLEVLEIKNCTFRINRDIRFSKDKSPYKSHCGIWMSTNANLANAPGYYIHLERGASFIAGGLYAPEAAELKKIRKEIAFFYEDLESILDDTHFKNHFSGLSITDTNSLKNGPKDFDKNHPAIQYLKLKSFVAVQKIEDQTLLSPTFVKDTAEKLVHLKPLLDFLNRGLYSE
jgi:uncharacterized protein (TIGR02453 family)